MRRVAPLLLLALAAITSPRPAIAADEPPYTRQEDVIYGRKFGTALTMDVFRPKGAANGAGVVMVVSGGFFSSHEGISLAAVRPLVDRGYTVFAVVHGSQPRYTVDEIVADMHRAVRFIRHHAKDYGIDPNRIGVTGSSAGGHLSLMLGTAGAEGDPKAKDPVDRESSRVQAVACFFPPTDFLNFGETGKAMVSATDHGKPFRPAFDHKRLDAERNLWVPVTDPEQRRRITRDISPISHISPDDAPTFIIHGDADQVVALQQSETFMEGLKRANVTSKLDVRKGAGHGWPDMNKDIAAFADWFDVHLKAAEKSNPTPPIRESRADQPPRKVVIGTAIFGPYGPYPGLDARLKVLAGLVDDMARRASEAHPGRGLDLAILPESAVTSTSGPPSQRAIRLDGPARDTFAALARKHKTYIIAPMDLAEGEPGKTTYSNAAVLFDRKGEVAGIYRKAHPVAVLGTDELEGGIKPGTEFPVFPCDFGKLGIQICWDIQFDDGWDALAKGGAEIVAWPSASPATAQPASRAARHRYHIVSSTWREDATVFEPTGLVAAQVEGRSGVLIHQLDLSHALLGWSAPLRNGQALSEKFGDRVGYHYSPREDLGLFWSNDPKTTIGDMFRSLGLEPIDDQVRRNRRLHDAARNPTSLRPASNRPQLSR